MKFVEENLYLFIAIISFLVVLLTVLIIMLINKRKRNNIKKEFEEITKIEEENEKIESEEVNPEVAFELEKILEKMQEDVEMKPEDVVKKFEDEQEQKAIISYQELLNSVNNNKIEVVEDDEGDIDFVAALEQQMQQTDNYINEIKQTTQKAIKEEKNDDISNKSHLDIIDVMNMDDYNHKFQSSEILSPVFGRMQPDFEYKVIDSHALSNNKVELEQVAGPTPKDELKANEDFLRALIDFRKKLE